MNVFLSKQKIYFAQEAILQNYILLDHFESGEGSDMPIRDPVKIWDFYIKYLLYNFIDVLFLDEKN